MTSCEIQSLLMGAATIELEIRNTFKELDRLRNMINHKDAENIPSFTVDLILESYELLGHTDILINGYKLLISIIQEEPINWRASA